MEGRIGDSALSQLVHLIFATCMPWFRKDFAAPDGYSCIFLAAVSQGAHHAFANHLPQCFNVRIASHARGTERLNGTIGKVKWTL
jgi:hypothetical protein